MWFIFWSTVSVKVFDCILEQRVASEIMVNVYQMTDWLIIKQISCFAHPHFIPSHIHHCNWPSGDVAATDGVPSKRCSVNPINAMMKRWQAMKRPQPCILKSPDIFWRSSPVYPTFNLTFGHDQRRTQISSRSATAAPCSRRCCSTARRVSQKFTRGRQCYRQCQWHRVGKV